MSVIPCFHCDTPMAVSIGDELVTRGAPLSLGEEVCVSFYAVCLQCGTHAHWDVKVRWLTIAEKAVKARMFPGPCNKHIPGISPVDYADGAYLPPESMRDEAIAALQAALPPEEEEALEDGESRPDGPVRWV